jgi:hypothetical protein
MLKALASNVLKVAAKIIPANWLLSSASWFRPSAHMLRGRGLLKYREKGTGLIHVIDCESCIERTLVRGDYAREFEPLLERFLVSSLSAIDCGANVGAVSLRIARRLTGTNARLLAIEAGPLQAERLNASLMLNPHLRDRVIVINQGRRRQTRGAILATRRQRCSQCG